MAPYVIPVRQHSEPLFVLLTPIGASASFQFPVREVAGYDVVNFLAISNLAFQIRVEEASAADGPWTPVKTFASVLVSGLQQVCDRINPCGRFMRVFLDNLVASLQTTLEFTGLGLPIFGSGSGPQGFQGTNPGVQGPQGFQGSLSNDLYAATRIVSLIPGDGTDLTIAAAIAALPAEGGEIYIKQGTYPIAATLLLGDKSIEFIGAGVSTVIDFSGFAIPLFKGLTGLSALRRYVFQNLAIAGNNLAGQEVLRLDDANGYGSAYFDGVRVTGVETIVNWTSYDVTFNTLSIAEFNSCDIVPSTLATRTLAKTPAVAGTFGGAVSIRFYETKLAEDFASIAFTLSTAGWTLDFDGDLFLEDCMQVGFIGGSFKTDGFHASKIFGVIINLGATDLNVYGSSWADAIDTIDECYFGSHSAASFNSTGRIVFDASFASVTNSALFNVLLKFNLPISWVIGSRVVNNLVDTGFAAIECTSHKHTISSSTVEGPGAASTDPLILLTDAQRCVISDVILSGFGAGIATIKETGAADNNKIDTVIDMSLGAGITLVGPATTVNGARRDIKAATSTAALVVVVPTITNPKGLIGVGTVKNTDGVNSLDVKESFTDAFGTTSTLTTTVTFGNSLLLLLQQNIGTGSPPYVSYKAEIIDTVAAAHATYLVQFTSQGTV
jgi:hypothetical protein